jgi:hypothetical protein
MAEVLVVALLVVACSLRAAWILAPAAARRAIARALLAWPLPGWLASRLGKHAQAASSGCACDGCDKGARAPKGAPTAAPAVAPITFHRRLRP